MPPDNNSAINTIQFATNTLHAAMANHHHGNRGTSATIPFVLTPSGGCQGEEKGVGSRGHPSRTGGYIIIQTHFKLASHITLPIYEIVVYVP